MLSSVHALDRFSLQCFPVFLSWNVSVCNDFQSSSRGPLDRASGGRDAVLWDRLDRASGGRDGVFIDRLDRASGGRESYKHVFLFVCVLMRRLQFEALVFVRVSLRVPFWWCVAKEGAEK